MAFIKSIFIACLLLISPISSAFDCFVIKAGVLKDYICQEKEIVIPETVTEIGFGALKQKGLTKVTFPPKLKIIHPYAVAFNKISHLDLPPVQEIHQSAFSEAGIRTLIIPLSSLTKLEQMAFDPPIFETLCPTPKKKENKGHSKRHKACPMLLSYGSWSH